MRPVPPRRFLAGLVSLAVGGGLFVVSGAIGSTATAAPKSPGSAARYQAGALLVTFKHDAPRTTRNRAHKDEGAEVQNTMEWRDTDVVRLKPGVDPLTAAERYRRNKNVVLAEPNWEVSISSVPNDPSFGSLWGLNQTSDKDIDAPEGWTAAYGAGAFPSTGGIRVGIVDSGIQSNHPDLVGKTVACARATSGSGAVTVNSCNDDNGHGTHVAGTIAANVNNGVGVAGVAPNAELAVFKALNSAGNGYYADIIAGIKWLRGTGAAKIISMSLGGPNSSSLNTELTAAYNAGVLLIAAAGNDGNSTLSYPAAHANVMSVSAITSTGAKASYSTCNTDVEIAAPGSGILSTWRNSTYATLNGTSMATPHVAGVAAVVMSKLGLTAAQTRSHLKANTKGPGNCNNVGVVNLGRSLGLVLPTPSASATTSSPTPTASATSSSPSPTPTSASPSPTTASPTPPPPPPPTPGAITGRATQGFFSFGLANVNIACGAAGTTKTNSSGYYTLSNVAPGTYTCTASATGYATQSASVTVLSGQTKTVNWAMKR